jgi:maltooligosyltrehalose trehalohydrolase
VIHDPLTPDVGVLPLDDQSARWRVWTSKAGRVDLVFDPEGQAERVAMEPEGRGYFTCVTRTPAVGTRYGYSLDGSPPRPDPASRWQPDGVNTPSAVYYPERFRWDEGGWSGVARDELVFYEVHVGTFTPEGTFEAIVPRVDALRDLGVTAIELMPVAQFPGRWSGATTASTRSPSRTPMAAPRHSSGS